MGKSHYATKPKTAVVWAKVGDIPKHTVQQAGCHGQAIQIEYANHSAQDSRAWPATSTATPTAPPVSFRVFLSENL